MSKYTFICEHWDGSKVTIEKESDTLSDVLESFEFFLKGAGFIIDGAVDITPLDEPGTDSVFDDEEDWYNMPVEYTGQPVSIFSGDPLPEERFNRGAGQPVDSFEPAFNGDVVINLETNAALHPGTADNTNTITIK